MEGGGYPFVFVMNDKGEADDILEYVMQYRFKSSKSNHTYIVRVERYIHHAYCVKFYDKANSGSRNKYSLRTNTYEPRRILFTIYSIMRDILNKDYLASFFFIGAEDEKDELGVATRRYRFYRRFVSSTISNRVFDHYRVNDISLYVLVNKGAVKDQEAYVNEITRRVRDAF